MGTGSLLQHTAQGSYLGHLMRITPGEGDHVPQHPQVLLHRPGLLAEGVPSAVVRGVADVILIIPAPQLPLRPSRRKLDSTVLLLQRRVLPAGRHLWAARGQMPAFRCHFSLLQESVDIGCYTSMVYVCQQEAHFSNHTFKNGSSSTCQASHTARSRWSAPACSCCRC